MTKRYHVERQISAPAERVWALLTDGQNYTSWNPAVVSLDGSIRQGETISLVSVVNPKRTFKLKVAEMSAPDRMVWSDGMPLGLFKGVRTYLLDERDGVTTFSMTEEFSGPLSGMITKAIPDMTDSFNQFADGLKKAAEAQPAPER
ncbi:MAG: SRPBCC family protein [Acidimicrobiales bacterium]